MALKQNFELMAKYNQWMNEKIYCASVSLDDTELSEDRGAFFGSVLGTLHHILIGDTIWLKRFADHPTNFNSLEYVRALPSPSALSKLIYSEFDSLKDARIKMDAVIVSFCIEASEADYEQVLTYKNTKGYPFEKKFAYLIHHFFNHQTHHRGQVSTLLSQRGVDVGITDLLEVIPNVENF